MDASAKLLDLPENLRTESANIRVASPVSLPKPLRPRRTTGATGKSPRPATKTACCIMLSLGFRVYETQFEEYSLQRVEFPSLGTLLKPPWANTTWTQLCAKGERARLSRVSFRGLKCVDRYGHAMTD